MAHVIRHTSIYIASINANHLLNKLAHSSMMHNPKQLQNRTIIIRLFGRAPKLMAHMSSWLQPSSTRKFMTKGAAAAGWRQRGRCAVAEAAEQQVGPQLRGPERVLRPVAEPRAHEGVCFRRGERTAWSAAERDRTGCARSAAVHVARERFGTSTTSGAQHIHHLDGPVRSAWHPLAVQRKGRENREC